MLKCMYVFWRGNAEACHVTGLLWGRTLVIRFVLQRTNSGELSHFDGCKPEQTVEQTVTLPVTQDTTEFFWNLDDSFISDWIEIEIEDKSSQNKIFLYCTQH